MAEREGFEPSKEVTPLSGLANRRTRPLCDLSVTTFQDKWQLSDGAILCTPIGRLPRQRVAHIDAGRGWTELERREQAPGARNAFEFMRAALFEFDTRAGDQIFDGGRHEHLARLSY